MNFTVDIKNHTLEYFDDDHLYLVDGIIVPSITQVLGQRFSGKYRGISSATLKRASDAGTKVHEAIEMWCRDGQESDLVELRNFKFLLRQYKFQVLANEIPVILFMDGEPVSAGRLDMVITDGVGIGLADIKRTASLDKEYLFYQLNLYRIAFQQCYDTEISFLRGIHLREDKRKYVKIPIGEDMAIELVKEYMEGKNVRSESLGRV